MSQWPLCPFSVTPAASVLSRCVSSGALSQEEIDSVWSGGSSAFSSHLDMTEELIRMKRQLKELRLQMELLEVEKHSADVTHQVHLSGRFQMLQMFCVHLQEVLKEHNNLRHKLMKPLEHTHLPVHAHLHRPVVQVVQMLMGLMGSLEETLTSVRQSPTASERITQLDSSLVQILTWVDSLTNQALQWQEVTSAVAGSDISSGRK